MKANDYITRHEAIRALQINFGDYGGARRAICKLPAADVAPVVRCKDCQWFADNNDGSWLGCWLFQTIQIIPEDAPKPDDFCSYGEPKMQEVE